LSLFIPEVIAADLQRRCRRQVDDVIEMSAFPVCRGHDAGRRPPWRHCERHNLDFSLSWQRSESYVDRVYSLNPLKSSVIVWLHFQCSTRTEA